MIIFSLFSLFATHIAPGFTSSFMNDTLLTVFISPKTFSFPLASPIKPPLSYCHNFFTKAIFRACVTFLIFKVIFYAGSWFIKFIETFILSMIFVISLFMRGIYEAKIIVSGLLKWDCGWFRWGRIVFSRFYRLTFLVTRDEIYPFIILFLTTKDFCLLFDPYHFIASHSPLLTPNSFSSLHPTTPSSPSTFLHVPISTPILTFSSSKTIFKVI